MTVRAGEIVCFSYLAAAQLWRVPQFPTANSGAPIVEVEDSIAADAPMTAPVLSALGVPVRLVTNEIGDDRLGEQVRTWLRQHRVPVSAAIHESLSTPSITVVVDGVQTRFWFAHLPGVVGSLLEVDLSSVQTAAFVYVDASNSSRPPRFGSSRQPWRRMSRS